MSAADAAAYQLGVGYRHRLPAWIGSSSLGVRHRKRLLMRIGGQLITWVLRARNKSGGKHTAHRFDTSCTLRVYQFVLEKQSKHQIQTSIGFVIISMDVYFGTWHLLRVDFKSIKTTKRVPHETGEYCSARWCRINHLLKVIQPTWRHTWCPLKCFYYHDSK